MSATPQERTRIDWRTPIAAHAEETYGTVYAND